MHPAYIIQPLCAVVAVAVACVAISKWRQPRLMYFTCLSIIASVLSIGYLLEITAPTLEAAVVATKLQQLGSPFIGVVFLLLCLDLCDASFFNRRMPLLLFIPSAVMALSAFTWPMQHWYYDSFTFQQTNGLWHIDFAPGPLFFVGIIYTACMVLAGAICVLRYAKTANRRSRHILAVPISALLPLTAQALRFLGIPASHWRLFPLAVTLVAAIGTVYIAIYSKREWQALGRELVVENMKDAFILLDTRSRFVDANQAAYRYFPELKQMRIGGPVIGDEKFPSQLMTQDDAGFTLALDGEELYLRTSRSCLRDGDRVLGTGILVYNDTENQRLMEELQQLATHDALSGLFNRGTFFTYATRDFALHHRKREAASVLMIDIDHFKRVNDKYGHATGDKVITAVSAVLLDRLRHTDICGRYGGEEMAVWLPGAHAEGAALIADVIRRAVQHTTFDVEQGRFNVTVSIGVASINYAEEQTFEVLVNQADTALYQAKNSGRNRVSIYRGPA